MTRPARRTRLHAAATIIDAEQQRRAINRVSYIALWVWPAFHLLDIFMIVALYPGASYLRCAALRIANGAILVVTMWLGKRSTTSPATLRLAHSLSYGLLGLAISIMALQFGGWHSAYMHGISIVIFGRSILVPSPWRQALLESGLTIGSFPVVMAIAAVVNAGGMPAFPESASLALFASNYVFLIGSLITSVLAGHLAWAGQRQIYRARKIGRYRLEAPIAKGGMGEMWLAWDEALRRNVALKLLRTDGPTDASRAARFEREAHAASQLNDPHTIRIFDFGGTDDGIQFMAMEYLVGADLGAVVQGHGPMPPSRAVHLMRQACQSLAEAHDAGIVHRDIKPQNLYITRVGEEYDFLKLLDFGIARVPAGETDGTLTKTGVVPGTPAYIAPEMWLGKRADPRSDIYSLGATMHFLVVGTPPFGEGTVRSLSSDSGISTIASRLRPMVSAQLAAIVTRCHAGDPTQRFETVGELQSALAACPEADSWSVEDARQFWEVTHAVAISRWAASTSA